MSLPQIDPSAPPAQAARMPTGSARDLRTHSADSAQWMNSMQTAGGRIAGDPPAAPKPAPPSSESLPLLIPATSIPNRLDPDAMTGRTVTVKTQIDKNSPFLPGGSVTLLERNIQNGAPSRDDIYFKDARGKNVGNLRYDPGTGQTQGSVTAKVGANDVVFNLAGDTTKGANPTNNSATLSLFNRDSQLGVRVQLGNVFQGRGPTGAQPSTVRGEAILTPGGGDPATQPLQKPIELYVFGQASKTVNGRGGNPASSSEGGGVRLNLIDVKPFGIPVTGTASFEYSNGGGVNAKGKPTAGGQSSSASVNVNFGKPDADLTGTAQFSHTASPGTKPVDSASLGVNYKF